MQKFTTLTGVAAPLPMINVDTDMIIPKQFLKTIKRTGLGKSLFYELRYELGVLAQELDKLDMAQVWFAAALGIDGAVLGERSCDALSRRALRLSMGATLCLPFARSARIADDLARLKRQWAIELVAAVLDPAARTLSDFDWPRRAALVLGNETEGIRPEWLELCSHRVTIPMTPPVDSLNVGVAAGILMYHWRRAMG